MKDDFNLTCDKPFIFGCAIVPDCRSVSFNMVLPFLRHQNDVQKKMRMRRKTNSIMHKSGIFPIFFSDVDVGVAYFTCFFFFFSSN